MSAGQKKPCWCIYSCCVGHSQGLTFGASRGAVDQQERSVWSDDGCVVLDAEEWGMSYWSTWLASDVSRYFFKTIHIGMMIYLKSIPWGWVPPTTMHSRNIYDHVFQWLCCSNFHQCPISTQQSHWIQPRDDSYWRSQTLNTGGEASSWTHWFATNQGPTQSGSVHKQPRKLGTYEPTQRPDEKWCSSTWVLLRISLKISVHPL